MTNLCSCNFSFVELWCAGGWARWALQCASWCAPWVPCMMSIDMFTMVCRVNIAVCSMVCVISIAVCKLAQIRNTPTSLHKTPIQPRQCLQFSIRNVLHFNIYLWQIFLQNQKSDQKQNNLFCHFLFAKCTLSSWISLSTVLNAVHLTGEDPWKPMQLSIMKKYLCCICYSLNIGYSWMKSENPCILNISSRQQCALCNHDIVSVWKSIQKKAFRSKSVDESELTGGRWRWLDYEGDADTNFLPFDKKVRPGDHGMRHKPEKQHNRHEKFKKYSYWHFLRKKKFSQEPWPNLVPPHWHYPCNAPAIILLTIESWTWSPLLQADDVLRDFTGEEAEEVKRTKSFPTGRPTFLTNFPSFQTELPNIQMIPPKAPTPLACGRAPPAT